MYIWGERRYDEQVEIKGGYTSISHGFLNVLLTGTYGEEKMQNFYAVESKVHNKSDSDSPLSSKNSEIQWGEGYMHDLVCEVVADWGGGVNEYARSSSLSKV